MNWFCQSGIFYLPTLTDIGTAMHYSWSDLEVLASLREGDVSEECIAIAPDFHV